jgi:hypothetical protein
MLPTTRDEVPIAAGLSAKFEVASNATFSTSGTPAGNGQRDRKLVGPFPVDHHAIVETPDARRDPRGGQARARREPGRARGADLAPRFGDSIDVDAYAELRSARPARQTHVHLAGGHVGAVVSKKAAALWPQISDFWASRD